MDENANVTVEIAPSQEAVEASGDTAVEIATIEADRDVKLAEIHSETATELAEIEADETEDLEAWLDARLDAAETRFMAAIQETREVCNQILTSVISLLTLIPPSTPVEQVTEIIPATEPEKPDGAAEAAPVAVETVVQPVRRWL